MSRTVLSRGVDKEDELTKRQQWLYWLKTTIAVAAKPEGVRDEHAQLTGMSEESCEPFLRFLEAEHGFSQGDCERILDERHGGSVALPHARKICDQSPLPRARIRSSEERVVYAEHAGFRFDAFSRLLYRLGFWERLGPAVGLERRNWRIKVGSGPSFPVVLDLLNGGAHDREQHLDYEGLFADEDFFAFDLLRFHLHQEASVGRRSFMSPSNLSVPALVTALLVSSFRRGLPKAMRDSFTRTCGLLLDTRTGNEQRIRLSCKLRNMEDEAWSKGRPDYIRTLFEHLQRADEDLGPHVGVANAADLARTDAFVTLHGGDCEGAAGKARDLLATVAKEAVVLACGSQTPLDTKLLGRDTTHVPSEAAGMMAAMQADVFRDRFAGMPFAVDRGNVWIPPVSRAQILPADHRSGDTAGNAANAGVILKAYQTARELLRPLQVVIITARPHAARALQEFRSVIPRTVAECKVDPIGAAQLDGVGEHLQVAEWLNLACEHIKRLYMTGAK